MKKNCALKYACQQKKILSKFFFGVRQSLTKNRARTVVASVDMKYEIMNIRKKDKNP